MKNINNNNCSGDRTDSCSTNHRGQILQCLKTQYNCTSPVTFVENWILNAAYSASKDAGGRDGDRA